jgi:hypothetical protein
MVSNKCPECGEFSFLIPLHGPKGGPLRCPLCVGKWNAEHGRRSRLGRVVIRAIKAYLDDGGTLKELDELRDAASFAGSRLGFDPTGGLAAGLADHEAVDMTSELLADAIRLAHPDFHPPERRDLAHRTTQGLLALQPFVFAAPKPKPMPKIKPDAAQPTSDTKPSESFKDVLESINTYPCQDCRRANPFDYCDGCRAEWKKRQDKEREQKAEKQRKQYVARKAARLDRRAPTVCASCSGEFKGKREGARFCSDACRQKAHRNPVTVNNSDHRAPLNNRDNLWRDEILALIDRHSAVFQNDLLPRTRTPAQYQALCLVTKQLEADGKVMSICYWSRIGRPGFKLLYKPGYDPKSHKASRLKHAERLLATGSTA